MVNRITLVTVVAFRYDKYIAGSTGLRVPELVLIAARRAGRTLGAGIAMYLLRPRHKTQSAGFVRRFVAIAILQAAILIVIVDAVRVFVTHSMTRDCAGSIP